MSDRVALAVLFAVAIFAIAIVNLAAATAAKAHHHNTTIIIESPPSPPSAPEPTTTATDAPTVDVDLSRAVALAGAVNHQFTYDTHKFQGSIVGATYDSEQAISMGIAKRFEQMDALWHGAVSIPDGGSEELWTFGATFRF